MPLLAEGVTPDAGGVGLSSAEAASRLARDGPNALPSPSGPSLPRRAASQLAEPLSLVLLGAALVSIVVLGHIPEGAAIAAIVALNVAIGVLQESRAADAIAALQDLTAPTARARRDGVTLVIPAADLVRGDVVDLLAGDRVPADVRLVVASSLAVDQAILTGESFPVDKAVTGGDRLAGSPVDRPGEAFAGTMVVRGRGVGIVTRTGPATEMGAIASALQAASDPPLVGSLRSLAGRMSMLAIAVGGALVPIEILRARGEPDAVVNGVLGGVALAVAAIPEGMATVVVSALALGARRLAGGGAIVRRLAAVEGVGSTDVLCIDKTGTITTGQLEVAQVMAVEGRELDLWHAALRCNDARDGSGDPLDVALEVAARRVGIPPEAAIRRAERPFTTEARCMATIHLVDGRPELTVKGAPEVVLARCPAGEATESLRKDATHLAREGMRIIAFATRSTEDLDATGLEPLGVIAFHDPPRASAAEAVARCRAAGIRLVVVTGDHPDTARAVAAKVGITGVVVTGDELDRLSEVDRRSALRRATVVARVDPTTKLDLITAHQEQGRIVAMTGDGVNDAPALRSADVGIAIAGEEGTDVARDAADIVVTNGDLGTIVAAVREGRRIHWNLRSVVAYLVTGNFSEVLVLLSAFVLLPDLAVPLLPVQLLWINLVTDGLPALALGVDRLSTDPLATRASRDALLGGGRLVQLMTRGAVIATAVAASGLLARRWGWDDPVVRTQMLTALLATHVLLAFASRARRYSFERGWWRNRVLLAAVLGSLALHTAALGTSAGRAALDLAPLPPAGWLLTVVTAAVALAGIDGARARSRP